MLLSNCLTVGPVSLGDREIRGHCQDCFEKRFPNGIDSGSATVQLPIPEVLDKSRMLLCDQLRLTLKLQVWALSSKASRMCLGAWGQVAKWPSPEH